MNTKNTQRDIQQNLKSLFTTSKLHFTAIVLFTMISCQAATIPSTSTIAKGDFITFVYTSDAHYGITRATLQGATNVSGQITNEAMIKQINTVPTLTLPNDGGVNAGYKVDGVDFLIEGGDVANREEVKSNVQSATISWSQFLADYTDGVKLTDKNGNKTKLYVIPGNHDVSNAIGYYKTMSPMTDAGSMAGIYNMAMHPSVAKTADNYNYTTDKIHFSFDISGIHFTFPCLWPDSTERIWLDKDMANVAGPVIMLTHDEPNIESKHLHNPNGDGTINATDKFENMVEEKCKDGLTTNASSMIEQQGFANWIQKHPNVKAYFHGNTNSNEFYTYGGPTSSIALPIFRVDSPMKGDISSTDETKLSFQLVIIDVTNKKMTVRECLWNTNPSTPSTPIVFGASKTISL
jgi:hypothetical protein